MRLITTYLIYSSTLIVSGFLLYFLHIRFTLLIDLTLLLCLNALFILKIDRISLKTKLKDLFPKKELISLAVFVYVLVSMGGFLTSQNTLTKRIEQAGRGNDSVSHLSLTNEISYLGKYILTANDAHQIKYNFQGDSPYPQGVHYLTAQAYLIMNRSSDVYHSTYNKINIFLWFNLFNLAITSSLICYVVMLFIKSSKLSILLLSSTLFVYFYSSYLQSMLLTGFYNAYTDIALILLITYLLFDLIKNGLGNLRLFILGTVLLATSYTYTFYYPAVIVAILLFVYKAKIRTLINEHRVGSVGLITQLSLSVLVFIYILTGNKISSTNFGGGIISIGYTFSLILIVISIWYLYKNRKSENLPLIYMLSGSLVWTIILFTYQEITVHTISYYSEKELYVPVTISVVIVSIFISEIFELLSKDKTFRYRIIYIILATLSIYTFLYSINYQENNYFDTTFYNFRYVNIPQSTMKYININGINISNKTSFDISAWVQDGEQENIAFLENCGSNDTLMSNRIAMAVSMNGNWAMHILEDDSTKIYGQNYDKNNKYIKLITQGLDQGKSITLLTGRDEAKLFDMPLKSNQQIIVTNYDTCRNY